MKYKIKNLSEFEANIFGGDMIVRKFIELLSTGVELIPLKDEDDDEIFYFIANNGKIVSDSAFFTENEMKYLEICNTEQSSVKKLTPIAYSEYDNLEEVYYHYAKMVESPDGKYVELENYQNVLNELNALKKKLGVS